ncbi:conserved hypothetical protein [Treponema phagedenis]|uniref:Uncharacterized protein n=1 Tax=Treponema phagedenis TaxID=162 RepID=A0A0B7GQ89_TREPH|nr:conserved hypothetical protein [Treponema phagedenis]
MTSSLNFFIHLTSKRKKFYKKEFDTTVSFCHPWQNETYEF